MPRRHRPSQFRFAKPLFAFSAPALAILLELHRVQDGFCAYVRAVAAATPSCVIPVPSYMLPVLAGVVLLGLGFSAFRFYRDFIQGDYYVDVGF